MNLDQLDLRPVPRRMGVPLVRARFLGRVNGQRVSEWPVIIKASWLSRTLHEVEAFTRVTATSASDAAAFVKSIVAATTDRPVEITVVGPQGGERHFFIGWSSMIMAGVSRAVLANSHQQNLNLT